MLKHLPPTALLPGLNFTTDFLYLLPCSSTSLFSTNFSKVSPSHGPQFFKNCSSMGPFHGVTSPASKPALAWGPLSRHPQILPGALLLHRVLHGLQVDICSSIWSISSPSFFSNLGVSRLVSPTYSLFPAAVAVPQGFFPLLKYIIPEALPWSLLGSALASSGSVLKLGALAPLDVGEACQCKPNTSFYYYCFTLFTAKIPH